MLSPHHDGTQAAHTVLVGGSPRPGGGLGSPGQDPPIPLCAVRLATLSQLAAWSGEGGGLIQAGAIPPRTQIALPRQRARPHPTATTPLTRPTPAPAAAATPRQTP